MKALFSTIGGIKPKLSLDGYSYTLFVSESQKINPGRNVIKTGVLIYLPKKLKACVYPIPEYSVCGLSGFDADVLPIIVSNGEIVIPVYNRGNSFNLKKGVEIAMLLLNRAYRLERNKTAFSINDTLIINKENCDKIKCSKSDLGALWVVDYTYRKKKRTLIFSTEKNETECSFNIIEVKKKTYVIDDGLGGQLEIKKKALEYIAVRKDV